MAQCVKELSVTDPPFLLDQLLVHDGDVSCRAPEADPPQLEPKPQRFPQAGLRHRIGKFILRHFEF